MSGWKVGKLEGWKVGTVLLSILPTLQLSAQCPDGSPPPCTRPTRTGPADRAPSLTVLYLENASEDPNDAALADGITEEVITRLSRVSGLRVTSRYAALRYRHRLLLDPRLAGRELGVRYVLQGTLRRSGDRVRVQVAVTEVATGFNTWAQTYDQPLRDVFGLQDTVALQVVEAVRGRLTGAERARLTRGPETNPEAYQAYLRGRVAIRARTERAAAEAIALYRRAITLDSSFALAHAGLAHAYALADEWGWTLPGVPADSVGTVAVRAAARALAIDSTSAESWLAAAMAWRNVDPQRALAFHRRAVGLDSTNIEALHQLAWGYVGALELDSAIAIERLVTVRDPFYAYPYSGLAEMLNFGRRPLEAAAIAMQGTVIDSTLGSLYWQLAEANLLLHRPQLARTAATRALSLGVPLVAMRVLAGLARLQMGDTASDQADLAMAAQELRPKLTQSPGGLSMLEAGFVSGAYAQLNQIDSTLVWARRVAPGQRRYWRIYFERHWFWDPVRADPRFQALLAESQP